MLSTCCWIPRDKRDVTYPIYNPIWEEPWLAPAALSVQAWGKEEFWVSGLKASWMSCPEGGVGLAMGAWRTRGHPLTGEPRKRMAENTMEV